MLGAANDTYVLYGPAVCLPVREDRFPFFHIELGSLTAGLLVAGILSQTSFDVCLLSFGEECCLFWRIGSMYEWEGNESTWIVERISGPT